MKKVKTNKLGRRILSIVLTAALVVGLIPGNMLTVSAEGIEAGKSEEIVVETVSSNDATSTTECTCGTDDPAFHATNCPAYIAPENPQCYCAEKCTEDTLNVWCDVCGMQGVSACQGEDTAVAYANGVASITNGETVTNYATFDEALANWTDGTTLTLLADVTLTERIKTYAKGLSLDLNGHKIECSDTLCTIWIDGASGSELTIRDSLDGGYINGVVYAVNVGSKLCLESGTVETVDAHGDFTMTGGQIISEDGSGLYVQSEGDVVISGGEIYGSEYGVRILRGNVIISGDTKITGADQYAIRSNTSTEVVISGTPTISGGAGEFILDSKITLNTQPADGKVWRVKIYTGEITDGIFAVPGEGIALDASKFASAMDGYEVKKNAKGELLLCNHTEQTAVSNGDGTHNTTCNCGEATFDTNVACSGGVATDTQQAYCEYCNAPYGELNPDVHCDIIAPTMTTEELEDALLELLNSGKTDISIVLAAKADEEMFTAINTALCSSTAVEGSVNLTIAGVQVVTGRALGNGNSRPELNTDPVALKTLNFPDAVTLEKNALYLPKVQAVYLPKVTEWKIWGIKNAYKISTLVLTAPGTITADFTELRTNNIALKLHCNKKNDVTDGTTWQGVTWKSISFEHSYPCTATSANVITKECANCGKSGTLTITAEGGVYDGTTAYGATVEKTGILENEEVTVNYYQGDTLIGTEAPVDEGTYTAKITYEGVTASVTYMISTTPTAEMFTYIESAVYDGTKKSANVVVKDGITGIGAITNIKYYQNGTEVTPINAGTYTVKIDVADGDIYDAATDIEVGTFEITKANTVITWNDQTIASTGEKADITAPTITFAGTDKPEVELTYSYKAQGDAEYTTGLPTACGIYDVKVNVSATDNYNAVEDTMTLTITCTDADGNGICDYCGMYEAPERVDEYYQIANAGNLMWFAQKVNEGQTAINAKLTADIAMNGIDWTMMSSFAGTFDGKGHTISGLNGHIDMWAQVQCHGFIRTLNNGGFVKNLTFTGAKVFNHEGSGAISAIIVYTNQGTVENCVVKDSNIHHGDYNALGVVVGVNGGTIRNCASISNTMVRRFSSTKDICGFVWSNSGSIEKCFNYDCTYQNGSNRYAFTQSNTGTITNCYYYESSETISNTVATAKTADQFASGEVAYLLNGSSSENVTWYQKLLTDTYPVLDSKHGIVYYGYVDCQSQDKIYANTELSKDKPEHSWKCEPDEANTNKMTFSCTTDGCTKGGTITVTAPKDATYNGSNHSATVSVETKENEELIETPVITYTSLTEGVELVDGKPVNAGTYQANVSFEGVLSYQEFEIKKAILDVTGVTATGRTYEKGNASVVITEVALEGVADLDAVSVDVTGLKGTLSGANAGDYTEVTLPALKLTGKDKDNYVLTQPSKAVPTNVTISPQATGTAQNVTKKYFFSQENADTINLVSLLPKDCGTVVSYGTPAVTENVTYKVAPSIKEGTLTYTVSKGSLEIVGHKGTIKIDVQTQNYASVPITIYVQVVAQIPVTAQTEVTLKEDGQKLTYGQKLSALELTEVVFKGIDGETVTGTLQWKNGDSVPTVDTKKAAWEFVPAASYNDRYATAEGELIISVVPATPEVDTLPTVNAITYHPDTKLADIALSGGKMNGIAGELTGTWAWKDTTICPKAGDNTYVAVFTPEDSTNYKTKEVDITVSVAKATPYSKTAVAAEAITYGEALKNSVLSGGAVQYSETDETAVAGSWSWKEVTTKPVVADSNVTQYDVVFTPTDAENYNKVETKVTLTVNKAETTPNMPESTMNVLYSKKTVSAVKLPEDWVWNEADAEKELTVDVAVEATAIYNGADKGNYVTESVTILITRQACKHAGETEVKDAKKATCAAEGYTGDTYCKDCGAKIATGTKIDKSTAHTWDNGVVTKEATATEKGEKTYTCSVCKTTKKEEIPALGAPKVGEEIASEDGSATYKVTEAGENGNSVTYEAPTDKNQATVVVPATVTINNITYNVTTISDTAFAGNKKLTSVTIGDNVTGFSAKKFKGCSNLKTLIIGNGVTSIPANAFKNFKKLTTVKMGTGVKTIGKNAFYGCKKLKNLTLGKNVVTIGDKAFYKCTSLTKLTIPSKVKTIGKSAFYGCSKTKTLTIKSSKLTTKKIGSKAFSKTPKSMKVTIPKKKFKTYKSMLIKKGVNKKAKFKKS